MKCPPTHPPRLQLRWSLLNAATQSRGNTKCASDQMALSSSTSGTPRSGGGKFIEKIWAAQKSGKPFFSFEYFPPKTDEGLTNLYLRFDRMGTLGPVRGYFFEAARISLCFFLPHVTFAARFHSLRALTFILWFCIIIIGLY